MPREHKFKHDRPKPEQWSRTETFDEEAVLATPEDLKVNLPTYPCIWQSVKKWVVFSDLHVSKRKEHVILFA